MQEPTNLLEEEALLESELEKLYALHDKPSNKARRDIIVKEIVSTGVPLNAILSGIRALHTEDIHAIKFTTIMAAARRYVVHADAPKSCSECHNGFMVHRDGEGRSYSSACFCSAGEQIAKAQGLKRGFFSSV